MVLDRDAGLVPKLTLCYSFYSQLRQPSLGLGEGRLGKGGGANGTREVTIQPFSLDRASDGKI